MHIFMGIAVASLASYTILTGVTSCVSDVSEERKEDDGSGDCKPVVEGSDQFTATDTALPEPVKPEQAEEY